MAPVIYTVGHSTRSLEELIELLRTEEVRGLIDVRTAPGSRRNPQFGREALASGLRAAQIVYRHEPALGGFRRPHEGSENGGWEHPQFRGYADYMATREFAAALELLQQEAAEQASAIMCAEAQWWRCHRRLISDALVLNGWRVLHLGLGSAPAQHQLTEFAIVAPDGTLRYPPAQACDDLDAVARSWPNA